MKSEAPMLVLWRRKWIVLGVFLAFAISAAIVSKALEKVYETKSTLIVAANSKGQTFDQVQASQALARSYEQIIGSPKIPQPGADRLAHGAPKGYSRRRCGPGRPPAPGSPPPPTTRAPSRSPRRS